jgi:predicted metal-dependent hydrolase
MAMASEPLVFDADVLERLNRLSLTRSFTPQVDIDWTADTAADEYASLYSAWSLFEGSGLDGHLSAAGRVQFVKYQQMNLMLFTGLLERHAISALSKLYDLDATPAFAEYVGHFIKEEIYHHMMFQRAVAQIQASMPASPLLPTQGLDRTLRWLFRTLNAIPNQKLRSTMTFTIFRFAERVTIFANQMVQSKIPRRGSLINQVWAYHALDEARHVAFDAMVLERNRLWRPLRWIPRALAIPCCVWLSMLLNANEVWIARQLGMRVRLWHLPGLMKRTKAPFKRRVFDLLASTVLSGDGSSEGEGGAWSYPTGSRAANAFVASKRTSMV